MVWLAAVVSAAACARGDTLEATAQNADDVVARVGDRGITLREVDEKALGEQASQFSGTLRQAVYEARRQAIDQIVADHLLEVEAKSRGITSEELAKEVADAAAPVTASEVQAWYRTNQQRIQSAPLAKVQDAIRDLLTRDRQQETLTSLITRLKVKTPVSVLLDPPRLAIETAEDEPAIGPRDAKVQIVEYSDFQCPFCASAEPTVKQILRTYGDKVRVVYRDFPLPNHAQAFEAAEAAQCADAQGRFWQYHDRLFGNFGRLSPTDLRAHAAALSLNVTDFTACLENDRTQTAVHQDLEMGEKHGVSATPTFFINGRMLAGAQPFDVFKQIIDEELAR